jgi:urocanate hydratase
VLSTAGEIFASAARKHFGGTLAGQLVVAGGMGAMGGALPLAAAYNGAAFLGIDADAESIKRRVKNGYCEVMVNTLDEALRILKNAVRTKLPASVGLIGNCAEIMPELAARGVVPDLLTDTTPVAGGVAGYIPQGTIPAAARALSRSDPEYHRARALPSIESHLRGMVALRRLGSVLFDSNGIFALANSLGIAEARDIPDFRTEYLRESLDEGREPLLCVALSGARADMARIDRLVLELFANDERLRLSLEISAALPRFQGLPARTLWLPRAAQASFATAVNDLVDGGALNAPVLLARELRDAFTGPIDAATRKVAWQEIQPLLGVTRGYAWVAFEAATTALPRMAALAVLIDGTQDRRQRAKELFA